MFIVAHSLPGWQVVAVLTAVDDTIGIALMVLLIATLCVVIPHHIYCLGVGGLVAHDHACECSRDSPRIIYTAHDSRQTLRYAPDALGMGLFGFCAGVCGAGAPCGAGTGIAVDASAVSTLRMFSGE